MTRSITTLHDARKIIKDFNNETSTLKVRFKKSKNIQLFIKALANSQNKNITTLDLSSSDLSNADNVIALMAALKNNPQITIVKSVPLSINLNNRLDIHTKVLEQICVNQPQIAIKTFNANYCKLTDGSAITITNNKHSFKEILVAGNRIENLGAMLLFKTSGLKKLDLSYNNLADIHGFQFIGTSQEKAFFAGPGTRHQQFIEAFFTNSSLEELDLRGNSKISDAFLLKLMECRPTLKILNGKSCAELKKEIEAKQALSVDSTLEAWKTQKEAKKIQSENHPPHNIKGSDSIGFGYRLSKGITEKITQESEIHRGHQRTPSTTA